jgi:hypothetical protein
MGYGPDAGRFVHAARPAAAIVRAAEHCQIQRFQIIPGLSNSGTKVSEATESLQRLTAIFPTLIASCGIRATS